MTVKKTSINLPVDLHHQFKSACLDIGISVTDAMISAIAEWIGKNLSNNVDKSVKTPYVGDLTVSIQEYRAVERLLKIPRSGSSDAAAGIMTAMEAFDALAESLSPKPRARARIEGNMPADQTHQPVSGHAKP